MVEFSGISRIDVTIDGADEVDQDLNAVKGGGGALFREKILAAASDLMIAIVDSSKLVQRLGKAKVPVEVLPFASGFVEKSLLGLGAQVQVRTVENGKRFITQQGNIIFDLFFSAPYDPLQLAGFLKAVPGIVEHGLFLKEIDMLVAASGVEVNTNQRAKETRG